jgi:hypothetical protein
MVGIDHPASDVPDLDSPDPSTNCYGQTICRGADLQSPRLRECCVSNWRELLCGEARDIDANTNECALSVKRVTSGCAKVAKTTALRLARPLTVAHTPSH